MESKNNPNPNGCLAKALPDEPFFVLLARDPAAPDTIRHWCELRARASVQGEMHQGGDQLEEAFATADAMQEWRDANPAARGARPEAVELIDLIARALWRYNEAPGDFDKPEPGMQELMKQIMVDTAASVAAAIAHRPEVGQSVLKPVKTPEFQEMRGEATRIGGKIIVTQHGNVEAVDAPGITTAFIDHQDPSANRVGVICYNPEPGTVGVGMVAQLDADGADKISESLARLASQLREGAKA